MRRRCGRRCSTGSRRMPASSVQVFLVVGGFLAGQRLLPGRCVGSGAAAAAARPLPAACTAADGRTAARDRRCGAGAAVDGRRVGSRPRPACWQLLLHLLLLQDLAGVEALSAGVWYVAIAFQLHALLLLHGRARAMAADAASRRPVPRVRALLPWLLAGAVALSALWFNRQPAWDVAAPYFLAAYGLGVLVAWCRSGARRRASLRRAMLLVVARRSIVDWRDRLGLALARGRRPVGMAGRSAAPLGCRRRSTTEHDMAGCRGHPDTGAVELRARSWCTFLSCWWSMRCSPASCRHRRGRRRADCCWRGWRA